MPSKKPHISKSRIGSLLRCEAAFGYHYGMGYTAPPKWIMAWGLSFEHGCNLNWRQKETTGENIPIGDVIDAARDDLHQKSDSLEVIWDPGVDVDVATDRMALALKTFNDELGFRVQPVEGGVQKHIEVEFKGQDWVLDNYIDLVAKDGLDGAWEGRKLMHREGDPPVGPCIIDVKTTGKSGGWKGSDVEATWDPVIYDVAMHAAGITPGGFEFHISRHKNGAHWMKEPKTQIFSVRVNPTMRAGLLKLLLRFKAKNDYIIETGITVPNYGWACKGCGFRRLCRKDFGREPPK